MIQNYPSKSKTASELLIEILEQFGKVEGKGVVVAFTDEENAVEVRTNVGRIMAIGLLDVARKMVLDNEDEKAE